MKTKRMSISSKKFTKIVKRVKQNRLDKLRPSLFVEPETESYDEKYNGPVVDYPPSTGYRIGCLGLNAIHGS